MKNTRRFVPLFLLGSLFGLYVGCSKAQEAKVIGSDITNPMDVITSPEGTHFIILNANVDNKSPGSLLVLRDDKKVYTKEIPRMGKRIQFLGNALFVTTEGESGSDVAGQVLLYEWKNQNDTISIDYVKSWSYTADNCPPSNVVTSSDPAYPIFAVSCTNGALLVGKTADPLVNSTLQLVRKYPAYTRNALYIDTKRKLLFGFVTSVGETLFSDSRAIDAKKWNATAKTLDAGENDVPDQLEQSVRNQNNLQTYGSPYQFVVLDLEQSESAGFPYQDTKSAPDLVASELRWMYFNLNNAGTPDVTLLPTEKYYRTNFAEAKPGFNKDSFYLSHSGRGEVDASEHANNLIEVQFKGNPRATLVNGLYQAPLTKTYFNFVRKYGFKGSQTANGPYMQGFTLATLSGEKAVIINDSFRDIVLFKDPYYSIAVASLKEEAEEEQWYENQGSTDFRQSFYRHAFSPVTNRALVLSYHSNSAFLMQAALGSSLTTITEIH